MLTVLPLPDVLASLPIEFRTVAGIVASPMLEIIRVQWHLLLGVTHALLREMILGFSTEVVLLYYHCKARSIHDACIMLRSLHLKTAYASSFLAKKQNMIR
mmetsp:Transcript_1902/g.2746  ORF Transcript_1902/g.2746 Transcript_1902/m.2746 type:complete len:101 (+) Transcript_1902:483-785(+)